MTMAARTDTDYTLALMAFFVKFDRIKESRKRTPTEKELGPLPRPGEEDIDNAKDFRFRVHVPNWRGATTNKSLGVYQSAY